LLALFLSKEKDRCYHKQRSLPEQVKRWGRGGGPALKLLAYILRAPIRRGFALDQKRVYPATHAELSCSSKKKRPPHAYLGLCGAKLASRCNFESAHCGDGAISMTMHFIDGFLAAMLPSILTVAWLAWRADPH